jgi:hypothetical protein
MGLLYFYTITNLHERIGIVWFTIAMPFKELPCKKERYWFFYSNECLNITTKNPPLVAGEEGFIIISILNSGQSQNKIITVIR